MPARTASVPEASDHQKPGAPRIQNVVTRPMTPLIRNSQPNRIVTAKVASGGMTTAMKPRMTSATPSARYSFQC